MTEFEYEPKQREYETKSAISASISLLKQIRDQITEKNAHLFSIQTEQKRDIEPVYNGMSPVGFRVKGPTIINIKISDSQNLGKYLI